MYMQLVDSMQKLTLNTYHQLTLIYVADAQQTTNNTMS